MDPEHYQHINNFLSYDYKEVYVQYHWYLLDYKTFLSSKIFTYSIMLKYSYIIIIIVIRFDLIHGYGIMYDSYKGK